MEPFQYASEYSIVVCVPCQIAIVPTHARAHLQTQHPTVSSKRRDDIVERIQGIREVARVPGEVRYPAADSEPCELLPIQSDGLRCTAVVDGEPCSHVCTAIRMMQDHCARKHGWVNVQKRGGDVRKKATHTRNRLWREGQSYQQYFRAVGWKKYIPVSAGETDHIAAAEEQAQRQRQANQTFDEYERNIREAQSQRAIEGDNNRLVANAWLSFTGWANHLAQFANREQIQALTEKAADAGVGSDERRLEDACRGTRRLIRAAFATSTPATVSKAALESVNRRETGAEGNERPFYAAQQVKTVRKYSDSWGQILRYLWRTAGETERPKYRFTGRQARQLEKLRNATEMDYTATQDIASPDPATPSTATQDSRSRREVAAANAERRRAIEDACSSFWISMFDQELRDDEFESGVISGLAVLGFDTQNGSWKSALNYTPILSAIVSVMRALVVYRAWRMRQDSIAAELAEGFSEEEAKERARSTVEGVDALVQRFMTLREFGGRISPMDRILRTRTYGLKIRMTTKASGTVAWMGSQVLVNRIRFSMDDVRSVVHGLFDTAQARLRRDVLFVDEEHPLPALDVAGLADNAAEMSEGWNFLQDSRNEFPVDGERWMWRRLFAERAIERRFVRGSLDEVEGRDDIRWDEKKVEDYFRVVRRFKEEMAVLVHLTAGSPARATELISIQAQNGPEGRGQRGVFIENGMVEFVTSYHKGWSASKKSKIVHRYVPREVGELTVYSMWLLEPWVRQLQNMVREQTEFSPFIWEPQPEEDWKAHEDEGEGEEEDGNGSPEADEWSEDEADGKAPPVAKNVDGFWDTDRLRQVMKRESRKRIGVGIGVMDWRHAYPAIQRENTRDHDVQEALSYIYDDRPPPMRRLEDAVAEQSGHSRYMEDMIYGLLLTESPTATVTERNMFRKVSVDWHRFLGFRSAWDGPTADPVVQRQLEVEDKQARMRRWKQMREVDVAAQARRLYGTQARFRGVQGPALEAIVSGTPRVLAVMRTGGGKSWLFTLPAAGSRDGVTVVVVPTVSLRQDFVDRCQRDGVACAEWDGSRPPYQARIVLVTPESAVSQGFGRFIDEKQAMHQLERVVIDECHTILESNAEWRPKVLELCGLTSKGVQVVLLTATLPPSREATLFDTIRVRGEDVSVFRDRTSRSNVAYQVVEYERDEEDEQVRELVERCKEKYAAPGQVIVCCKKIEQATRLAAVLGCSVYHRTVGTDEFKKGILRRLTGQKERVFTATNALGLGVDAPTIRVVIHVGVRSGMAQYAQESGRAGRDGLASEAITMRARWQDRNGQTKVEQGWEMEEVMKGFLKGESCRRIPLDRHMDGREDRLGCEVGEERCDVCRGRPRGSKRRRVVVGQGNVEEVGEDKSEDEEGFEVIEGSTRKKQRRWISEDIKVVEEVPHEDIPHKDIDHEDINHEDINHSEVSNKGASIESRFEEENRVYGRFEIQRKQEVIEQEDGFEDLRQHFESWRGICVICYVRGRGRVIEQAEGGHGWRDCGEDKEDRREMERMWQWFEGLWFEKYACCTGCWAAQGICHSWEVIGYGGWQRFGRRRGGWQCQFTGTVRAAVAAVLALGHGEVVGEWIDEQVERKEQEEGREEKGIGLWEKRRRWMGRKVRWKGIEMSEMCRIFWEFGAAN